MEGKRKVLFTVTSVDGRIEIAVGDEKIDGVTLIGFMEMVKQELITSLTTEPEEEDKYMQAIMSGTKNEA